MPLPIQASKKNNIEEIIKANDFITWNVSSFNLILKSKDQSRKKSQPASMYKQGEMSSQHDRVQFRSS